jgi:hypothetical protein
VSWTSPDESTLDEHFVFLLVVSENIYPSRTALTFQMKPGISGIKEGGGVSFFRWMLEDENARASCAALADRGTPDHLLANTVSGPLDSTATFASATTTFTAAAANSSGNATARALSQQYRIDNTWRTVLLGLSAGCAISSATSFAVLLAANAGKSSWNSAITLTPFQSRLILFSGLASCLLSCCSITTVWQWMAGTR